MEKIIAAIRTLNDNLVAFKKETALEEANIHQRLDGMLEVTDGLRNNLDELVERIADYDNQFDSIQSRLADITKRVFTLEQTTTTTASTVEASDVEVGDALDDILGGATTVEASDLPKDVVESSDNAVLVDDSTDVEARDIVKDGLDNVVKDAMDGVLKDVNDAMDGVLKDVDDKLAQNKPIDVDAFIAAHAPAQTAPTTTKTKTTKTAKTKTTMTAVQKRAFARQYMVEVMNAKVEDLRSPAKIEETMASTEFEKWLSER